MTDYKFIAIVFINVFTLTFKKNHGHMNQMKQFYIKKREEIYSICKRDFNFTIKYDTLFKTVL